MNQYEIRDQFSFAQSRRMIIWADSAIEAQETYIDTCEEKGLIHGDLNLTRLN